MNYLSPDNITGKFLQEIPSFDNSNRSNSMSKKLYSIIDNKRYRHSSVLIPLISLNNSIHIILTLRSNNLPTHAGQISFPGGKVDPADINPIRTAYREADEEIGLN